MNSAHYIFLVVAAIVHCTTASPGTRAVLVKTIYGDESFYVIVPSYSESVETTKQLIAKKINVPAVDQKLIFGNEDMVNSQALSTYGVGNTENPTLFVAKHNDQIAEGSAKLDMLLVRQGTSTYYITLPEQESTTILKVKEIIAERIGLAAADLVLEFAGVQLHLDTKTLYDYNVETKTNPVVFVSKPRFDAAESVAVTVYVGDTFYKLRTGTEENIGSFKEQIRTEVNKARDVSLAFGTEEITDDGAVLVDFNITGVDNPVLHAAFTKGDASTDAFVLTVHHGEKRINILTASTEKVNVAKHNLERITGVPAVDQSLSFIYNELQNEQTMSEVGISDGSFHVVYLSRTTS